MTTHNSYGLVHLIPIVSFDLVSFQKHHKTHSSFILSSEMKERSRVRESGGGVGVGEGGGGNSSTRDSFRKPGFASLVTMDEREGALQVTMLPEQSLPPHTSYLPLSESLGVWSPLEEGLCMRVGGGWRGKGCVEG